ncbi:MULTISPECIES: hypothetical protein [unclassified Streptomyces]|uniref:hypothetical protein n=1 Tax=unclassified Streptomyces TaxID=2593676 RepID=UPI0028C3A12D|nr:MULTISPECIES: hypothetical protein [unclassified Streptomyces]WNO72722.1 hypothetical protein RPQ07_14245 [Streptomyces sp. AM8-1-1]
MRPKTAGTRARPTLLTALSAFSALLLATACTSDDGKEPAKGSDTPASSGATTGAGPADGGKSDGGNGDGGDSGQGNGGTAGGDTSKPFTGPQLERSALATGDLPGFQVSSGKSALAPAGQPTADTPTCQPLADAMGDAPSPRAKSTVNRGLGSVENVGLAVSASVSAYSEADAVKLMDGLQKAVGACGKGFTATLQGRSGSYREVKESPFTAKGADETVSWTAVGTNEGVAAPVHLVVVRQGATVARFMALDLARRVPPRVPQEVADKQLAKVGQVRAG